MKTKVDHTSTAVKRITHARHARGNRQIKVFVCRICIENLINVAPALLARNLVQLQLQFYNIFL